MSILNQVIQDRVSDDRIPNMTMPVLDGQLTGDQGGTGALSVLYDHQEISPFTICQMSQFHVIDDQRMGFGKSFHRGLVAAIGWGQGDWVEELERSEIHGSELFPATMRDIEVKGLK